MPAPRASADASNARTYVGIFFTFAPVGFLLGLMSAEPWGWGMASLSAVLGGLISVGWAWTFQSRRFWMIAVLIVLPVTSGWWLFRPAARLGLGQVGVSMEPFPRRVLLMCLALVCLASGFIILIRVMTGNERRAARLRTELDLASRIHQSLVPEIDRREAHVEVYGRSSASSEMGGDLIDVAARAGSLDVYLADISGHGVRAGVLMAMVKSALRTSLLEAGAAPPLDRVAARLNGVMAQVAEPDMFATFACLRVDASRRVEYVLAGHWPILLVRGGVVEELSGGESMPLGVDASEKFESRSVEARAGDVFVLLTDGLLEVMNAEGEPFGLERLKALIASRGSDPLRVMHDAVLADVRRFGSQGDDQSLVLARVA